MIGCFSSLGACIVPPDTMKARYETITKEIEVMNLEDIKEDA